MPDQPPTQRIAAQVTFYLGIEAADQVSLDTVRVGSTVYPVHAIDSLRFRYDSQQRLVNYSLTQVFQTYGQRRTATTRSEYSYQAGAMTEREDIGLQSSGLFYQHPLDSTTRRVTTYNKKGYSFLRTDSLRTYSTEGILISALQISINYGMGYRVNSPTLKATVQAGNVIQEENYSAGLSVNVVSNRTRFLYDSKHYAPLAPFTFLGETSRNVLLSKIVSYHDADGGSSHDYVYTNKYDGQGRLVQQLETHTSSSVSPKAVHYQLTRFYY